MTTQGQTLIMRFTVEKHKLLIRVEIIDEAVDTYLNFISKIYMTTQINVCNSDTQSSTEKNIIGLSFSDAASSENDC